MSNQINHPTQAVITDEFIVHTKHTCDNCYTRPIVGKRFTSGVLRDYDLCSKCYEGCDEEKRREFTKTLLCELRLFYGARNGYLFLFLQIC